MQPFARLCAALLVAVVLFVPDLAAGQGKRLMPVSSLQVSRDAVKAFRTIDARTAVGLDQRDYSREVASLKLAVDDLDETLQRRQDERLRQQLAQAFEPYRQASDLWAACTVPGACSFNILALRDTSSPVVQLANRLLEQYPQINASMAQGGVLMDDGTQRVFYNRLLSALWLVGQERGKALRAALQP